ncbi:MAG: pilus assembly protein [Hyphomonas sp.]|nr:pilus assembly protein [Hyphomonas sp.]
MKKIVRIFSKNDANVAVPGAVIFVAGLALVGGALDLMSVSNQKASLQELADNAALAAVREMAITADDSTRIEAVAKSFSARTDLLIESVVTDVNLEDREIRVDLTARPRTNFPEMFDSLEAMRVSATARLSGRGGNICMIGLSPDAISTLRLRSRARITAESCAIYSNSTSAQSMFVASTAEVKAELICVAGGYQGGVLRSDKSEDLNSTMLEDCAAIDDPLAMRVTPDYAACDFHDTYITGSENLNPGVYCGGLIVDSGKAKLSPGEYIVTGGPLVVTNNGTLQGDHVGFYLAGSDAKIVFDYDANIDVSAPRDGTMAGLLLYSSPFEEKFGKKMDRVERSTGAGLQVARSGMRKSDGLKRPDHIIRSDNARRMVGTIYLPSGKLLIDGRNPIADRSEYTVIIADTFELQDGPNLVLRTDYHLTDIPVPEGVGPVTEKQARLVK